MIHQQFGSRDIPIRLSDGRLLVGSNGSQLPGNEALIRATPQTVAVTRYPFGRETFVTMAGDKVYAGTGDAFEVRASDLRGKLELIVRRPHQPVPVTKENISELIDQEMEGFSPSRETM